MSESNLAVSVEVLEKITEMAALEIEGVEKLSKKNIDLKYAIKSGNAFKGVKVESINDMFCITVYICLTGDAIANEVALKVQNVVKERVQTMTGTAVTKVNVVIADVCVEDSQANIQENEA